MQILQSRLHMKRSRSSAAEAIRYGLGLLTKMTDSCALSTCFCLPYFANASGSLVVSLQVNSREKNICILDCFSGDHFTDSLPIFVQEKYLV